MVRQGPKRLVALEVDPSLLLTPDEQEEMIRKWTPYAHSFASKYWSKNSRWGSIEEYQVAAVEGLWQAARRFQPSKGFQFNTYATWWMRQTVQRWKWQTIGCDPTLWKRDPERLERDYYRRPSLDAELGIDGTPLKDLLSEKTTEVQTFPDDFWPRVNKYLDPRRQGILRLRYIEGKTLDEVGAVFGLTRERIRQIEKKALATLARLVDFTDVIPSVYGGDYA